MKAKFKDTKPDAILWIKHCGKWKAVTVTAVHISVSRKHKVSWTDSKGKSGRRVFATMYTEPNDGSRHIIPKICGAPCGQYEQALDRDMESAKAKKAAPSPRTPHQNGASQRFRTPSRLAVLSATRS